MPESPRSGDEVFVRRMQDGDQEVLREILQLHGGEILCLLNRRYASVLSAADLDDVMSMAVYRLWRGRERKQASGSLRAWFFRIADNVARDVLRLGWQKARRLEVSSIDEDHLAGTDSAVREEGSRATGSWDKVVREVVNQLPEVQRRIIWADALSRQGPADSAGLADELGLAASSVRVYRKRALDTIREELLRRGFPLDESRICHGETL